MKKVYNIILAFLIIIAIILGSMIFINHYKSKKNQLELANKVNEIENIINQESSDRPQATYEGFDCIGIIEIPKIGIKYPIIDASPTFDNMRISICKFWGTKLHDVGNFCIAGHHTYNGTMFGNLNELETNDIIKITDLEGKCLDYVVFDKLVIDPNDTSIVDSVDPTTREITLITCINRNKNRLIIKARTND